ncbi:hypothetical protein LTR28_000646, partial [Elasticomyces elasticus]
GRRKRQRQKKGKQGGGRPFDGIIEDVPGDEPINRAGDMVQNTASKAVGQVGGTSGRGFRLGGLTGEGNEDGEHSGTRE